MALRTVIAVAHVLLNAAGSPAARRRCRWCGHDSRRRVCSTDCHEQLSLYWQPGEA